MSVTVVADIFEDLSDYFEQMPDNATVAARIALNYAARNPAMKLARKEMYDQVNFPQGYLNNDRLAVTKYAEDNDLEAIVTGRDRPTSLARFASNPKPGQRGVEVQVHKGSTKIIKRGFIVKLRAGKTMDGKTFNVGLAIRLSQGETLSNKNFPAQVYAKSLGPNVILLYGPSVDQVFRSVSSDIQPEVADAAAAEFFRQFARLNDG